METFIQEITKEAGMLILKKFGKIGVSHTKKDATDVVTRADLAANKLIINAIKRNYPSHAIVSEESGDYQSGAEYCWIVDPMDGTRNFATRVPLFAVMIGLARNGKMEMAGLHNPCTDEFLFAKKGKGAFLNGKRVRCSTQKKFKDSWGLVTANMLEKNFAVREKVLRYSKKEKFWANALGSTGASTLYMADGRRDWIISSNGKLWDYAAPSLILSESGCVVTNFNGNSWSLGDGELLAGNKYLHPVLKKIIGSQT